MATIEGLKRLTKLVNFVDKKVPAKNFNLDVIFDGPNGLRLVKKDEIKQCGSVGCMMGWAPTCFRDDEFLLVDMYCLDDLRNGVIYFRVNTSHGLHFEKAAQRLFDINYNEARMLFNPAKVDERRDYSFPMKYEEGARKSHVLKNFRWFIDQKMKELKAVVSQ